MPRGLRWRRPTPTTAAVFATATWVEFRGQTGIPAAPPWRWIKSLIQSGFEQGIVTGRLVRVHLQRRNTMTKNQRGPRLTGRNDAANRVDRFTGCATYQFSRKFPLRSST